MSLPGRVTAAQVRKIIQIDTATVNKSAVDLDEFIDTANELVTEKCAPAGYTTSRLASIEKWLAAHFYCVLSPRTTMEKVGSIRQQFEDKVDLGLDLTRYGQMAMRLDTAGGLALMNNAMKTQKGLLPGPSGKTIKPGIRWMGTIPEEN